MARNSNNSRKPEQGSEAKKLIEAMVSQTRDLLENSWTDIQNCRKREAKIRITITQTLKDEGALRTVKTQIGFGTKFKDEEEFSFDINQLELIDAR